MPPMFSTMLDDTVTYAKWNKCGNGMPGNMSCGKITVETLEAVFLTNNRKLAPSDYVSRCLNVWEDPRVSNWIDQHRDEFAELGFNEFFIVLRDHLPTRIGYTSPPHRSGAYVLRSTPLGPSIRSTQAPQLPLVRLPSPVSALSHTSSYGLGGYCIRLGPVWVRPEQAFCARASHNNTLKGSSF
ncbi:hypothetical protein C8R41DRAFT_867077 [Lentinula lateritia]|uniref:Uncharacterized protein n=1 Tax=Lentinula lateritia TaxID=40482 RepID=A0ABQ8VIJ0_9AGAR|nr:hypothetical protein C8R41DRAFT_867077 [Lentinula lateritia]